jgi:hypothetical protein
VPSRPRTCPRVGEFLHCTLNRRIAPSAWARASLHRGRSERRTTGSCWRTTTAGWWAPTWPSTANARSTVASRLCNLGAWSAVERYRMHSIRLLKAVLAQPGYTFTDLSPSPHVVALSERLGFTH